jgi:hypothetical protein
VPIPIWDLGTLSSQTVGPRDDDGRPRAISKVILQNRGGSTTPGPVQLSAVVAYTDGGYVGGWSEDTSDPIAAGATAEVYGSTFLVQDRPLDRDRARLRANVLPLCPDGTAGDLSDGHRADNLRVLRQLGQAPTTP